jgi:NADH:ubiquinone oxidoreductase subunit F (NADH-binding)
VAAALGARSEAGIDPVPIRLFDVPDRYVAGEETALVRWLNRGLAKPTFTPRRPFERGVGGRPTLVQNVETLAHLALLARFGDVWFREVGLVNDAGSTLVTVSGAIERPGVYELALGSPLSEAVRAAGGATEPARAFLVGGFFGG